MTAFENYFAPAGVVGVLGIGPNDGYPGTSTIVQALPGVLNNGVLIDEPSRTLVFGTNTSNSTVSVTGVPSTPFEVKVSGSGGSGTLQPGISGFLDSGGVYGTIPSNLVPSLTVGDAVPSGTTISVYSSDGSTLLYTYTTTAFNGPTVISTGGYMNTGYEPFIQQPIYVGYQQTAVGTAVFVS